MTIKKYPKEIKRKDFITVRNTARGGVIQNVIAPNGLQVGLNNPDFKAGLRIFGQVDTSDDILLFGNSLAAAVLDINLNPSSAVIFSDPADKEVFIQASTITADAFYSGKAMAYDGLATSNKDIKTDYTYKPRFDAITGDNGIGTISSVSVGGAVSGTKSGTVTLTDSHNTSFMTLTFAVDSSTGDLTITPNLTQVYTNSTEITNITLKIPVVAKSNNPKPLLVTKEVHIQKMEFPTIASHTAKPIAYVLRHNAAGAFSTLDLANVQFRVSYAEGYNYTPSSGSPVTSTDLTPNVTANVGSVSTLSNGQFTIKSITDIDCTTKSSTFQAVPATSGSAAKEIRLTTLSAADSSKTFAARSIETLYKTTTGLVGSDRILQQFIIQETRESVTVESTDKVRYLTTDYSSGTPLMANALTSSTSDGVRTVSQTSGNNSAKFYTEAKTSDEQITPNNLALSQSLLLIPMDHIYSASSVSSNLATPGSTLMNLTTANYFTSQTDSGADHNESFLVPAGTFQITANVTFEIVPSFQIASNPEYYFYCALVKTKTAAASHDVIEQQAFNRDGTYDLFQSENYHESGQSTETFIVSPQNPKSKNLFTRGAFRVKSRFSKTAQFSITAIHSSDNSTAFAIAPILQFGKIYANKAQTSAIGDFPKDIASPTIKRTNLTLTVTEL